MGNLTIELGGCGDGLTIDDMGDGLLIFSQRDEGGRLHRVTQDLGELMDGLAPLLTRYGLTKNTDRVLA